LEAEPTVVSVVNSISYFLLFSSDLIFRESLIKPFDHPIWFKAFSQLNWTPRTQNLRLPYLDLSETTL